MELLQLRYFQAIANLGSVTRAAAYYHIPQPAMSQSLSRLEHELGDIKLFDRRNNHVVLNEAGQNFLTSVETSLNILDDGVKKIKSLKHDISGPIHILVMENRRFISYCVPTFSEMHPNLEFQLCHDFYSDTDQDYDLCISSNFFYKQMKSSVPLIKERIILAVQEDHPLAQRKSISLSELQNEKFITMTSRSSLYKITVENCRRCGFEPHIPFTCDDPYYVRKYISLNMGVALAPSVSWAGRFRSNTKLVPVENPEIYTTSYILWNDLRYQSPAVRTFRDYLISEAKKLDGNLLNDNE